MTGVLEADAYETVAAAASGDHAAFARIVRAFDGDMARVAYLVSGDLDLAHDAVQSAWAIAWRKLGSLRDAERLRPWLVSVAANEARRLVRRASRRSVVEIRVAVPEDVAGRAFTEEASDRERLLDLRRAIQGLNPEDRAIVAMRYAVGLTSAKIAVALGMSGTAVRSRLSRALDKLRKELGDD